MYIRKILRAFTRSLLLAVVILLAFCCNATAERLVDTIGAIAPGQMPCIGNPKVLVFCVTFPGGELSAGGNHITLTTQEVESWFFNPALKNSQDSSKAYTEEDSVRSYYFRSSYGKVDITGSVYEYTAKNDASYYTHESIIWAELFAYYEDQINWSDYDTNNDGYLDGAYILARTLPAWTSTDPSNFVTDYWCTVGGIKTNRVCYIRSQDFRTFCHETYHMFGLGDIYAGQGLNPAGINTECIMGGGPDGGGLGDIPGISKYVLGWIDNARFVSGLGTQRLGLSSYSVTDEIVVIYPNGDKNNRNWYVVEYVTNEANNRYNGIRVWRTDMRNLDEFHNIVGAVNVTQSRPQLPMEYIEAISPEDTFNYFYQAGEAITPTSSPSSAYGAVYKTVGSHKYITELAYSGISILVENIYDDVATLTIKIEDDPTAVVGTADFQVINPSENSIFIDLAEGYHFATITADMGMRRGGELCIKNVETGEMIPVTCVMNSKGTQARLVVPTEHLAKIELDGVYYLQTEGVLTSYVGQELNFPEFNGTFSFSNLVIPLTQGSDTYILEEEAWGIYRDLPTFMILDDTHACFVRFAPEKGELSLVVIDSQTNTLQEILLETDIQTSLARPYVDVWRINEACFGVLIRLTEESSSYLAAYGFDGRKIDGVLLEDTRYDYVGQSSGAFIVKSHYATRPEPCIYEVVLSDGKIQLVTLDYIFDWLKCRGSVDQIRTINKIDDDTYAVTYVPGGDPHVEVTHTISRTQAAVRIDQGMSAYRKVVGDKVYMIKRTEADLELDIYSNDGFLEEEITLLRDLPITPVWGCELIVEYTDNFLIVCFDEFSSYDEQSWISTYLFVFDSNFQLAYYYRSDRTDDNRFRPLYIGNKTFVIFGGFEYSYLRVDHDCEADGHIEVNKNDTLPTCTTPGCSGDRVCGVCGLVLREGQSVIPVDSLRHTWKGVSRIPQDCVNEGQTIYKCTECGYVKNEAIAPNGHNYKVAEFIDSTTCTPGLITYMCAVCNGTYSEIVGGTKQHKYVTDILEATCTVNGYISTSCSICGNSLDFQVIPPLGHTYTTTIIEPTCELEGANILSCTNCDYSVSKSLRPKGHTEVVDVAVNPTCGANGLTEGKHCSVCGTVIVAQTVIPAKGHTEVVDVAVEPTCTEPGLSAGSHCSECNTVLSVQMVLPAMGHYWIHSFSALPSEDTNGINVEVCLWCNESKKEIIPHLGCTSIPGDADCNGTADVYDALLILQNSAGWDVKVCSINADADGDGAVTIDDALRTLELCFAGDMTKATRALQAMLRNMTISPLQIVEQPIDQYAMVGRQAQFAVTATGDGLTYQWYINRNDGKGWLALANATKATCATSAVIVGNDGWQYRCVVTDVYGNEITSEAAVLHVVFDLPNTGDASEPLLYALAMIAAGAILLYVCARKRAWQ